MFCTNCGTKNENTANFCTSCGTQQTPTTAPVVSTATQSATGFTALLHKHVAGGPYFIGLVLLSVGTVIPMLSAFSFFGLIGYAIGLLPIIGYWFIFYAAQSPQVPDRSLTGLTLWKVSAVIALVLFCIVFGVVTILALLALLGGGIAVEFFGGGGAVLVVVLVLYLIYAAVSIAWIKFFYIAMLNVVRSIREGVITGSCAEIKGVGSYTILSFIFLGFSLLGNLISLTTINAANAFIGGFRNDLLREIPSEFRGIVGDFIPFGTISILPILFSIAASLGTILILVTWRKLAEDVRLGAYKKQS
jgi:hypothetical protein